MNYINSVFREDLINLIECLCTDYNTRLSTQFFINRYMPNITIKKKKKFVLNRKRNKPSPMKHKKLTPAINKFRCVARCWGGDGCVKYDTINKKWIYGTRCKRVKYRNDLCKTHLKQFNSSKGLRHGRFDELPPHEHYLKYKQKIEKKLIEDKIIQHI